MFLFLTRQLSVLISSVERLFSEILENCLNDVYALSRNLLLTHSSLTLVISKLVISLNNISKAGKNSEHSVVFIGMAKIKDTMKAYFCNRHTLLYTMTLSRLFYLF